MKALPNEVSDQNGLPSLRCCPLVSTDEPFPQIYYEVEIENHEAKASMDDPGDI